MAPYKTVKSFLAALKAIQVTKKKPKSTVDTVMLLLKHKPLLITISTKQVSEKPISSPAQHPGDISAGILGFRIRLLLFKPFIVALGVYGAWHGLAFSFWPVSPAAGPSSAEGPVFLMETELSPQRCSVTAYLLGQCPSLCSQNQQLKWVTASLQKFTSPKENMTATSV